jgi:Tfp pilus assembly protein PilF
MIDITQMLQEVIALYSRKNLRDAEITCRKILALEPDHPDANHFFGIIAYETGNFPVAREYVNKALGFMPQNASCYLNMGNIVQSEGNFVDSIKWYQEAIKYDAAYKRAYNNIGVALTKLGKLSQAVENLQKAIDLDPQYFEAHNNIGETWRYLGEYERSLVSCERALSIMPDFVPARWNRSILYLLNGQFEQGWAEYEWRWKRPNTPIRKIDAGVMWDGSPFAGKTLFVYEEQGMGDTLQFIRYLPLVKQLGGHIIFEVLTPMIRLVESFQGFDRLWVGLRNVDTRPVDRFDFHIPLLSLPRVLNANYADIPADIPYLKADKKLIQIWNGHINSCNINNDNSLKVGIVWAGHPSHTNDNNRSVLLSTFSTLKNIEGVKLFSLQKDKYKKWTDIDPDQIFEQDLGEQISDFADTAAMIENLDLVISVDTAIVHLAGALGKNVWTLLPFSPDWRWMINREDSPWYPTMKLFRQSVPGSWEPVFENVKAHLMEHLQQKN